MSKVGGRTKKRKPKTSGGGQRSLASFRRNAASLRSGELRQFRLKRSLFDEADKAFLFRLRAQLQERATCPAVFLGAGVSVGMGYPTWTRLLADLHQEAFGGLKTKTGSLADYVTSLEKYEDVAWRAQEYRDAIANEPRYLQILKRKFSIRKGANNLLQSLVRLPIRNYITTNYDDELERAYLAVHRKPLDIVRWTDASQSAEWLGKWSDPERATSCVYLHGRCDDPKSMVLTERDYQHAYFNVNGSVQRLSAILLLQPVLFMGFSLTDPDLMALLRQSNALCMEGAHHHALIGLRSPKEIKSRFAERARLRRKFGVNAIFFHPEDDYGALERIVSFLSSEPAHASRIPKVQAVPLPITEEYCWKKNEAYPADPLKGRFGGRSYSDKWRVTARIERTLNEPWPFDVCVTVTNRATSRARLTGRVDYFVHPTFPQYRYYSAVRKGVAKYTFHCLGSFTLGIQVHRDNTILELDLAEIEGAPLDFQFS